MSNMNVAVGLSGGVDSAVTAMLLQRAGYSVTGVIMTIWDGRALPVESTHHACYGPGENEDVAEARAVSEALGIPFKVLDLAQEYNAGVLAFCSEQYRSGVTPNPCVYCNRKLKFELIPERLRAQGLVVDYFATGHYARVEQDQATGRFLLKRALDHRKDQTYFLYQLSQELLRQALFPLGDYHKEDVRKLALAADLPVAGKPESQDFAAGSYQDVLGLTNSPGPILNAAGQELGQHDGIHHFTVGQRRGLNITHAQPLYVTALDPKRNAVIVGEAKSLTRRGLIAGSMNLIALDELTEPIPVQASIRSRHQASPGILTPLENGKVELEFDEPQRAVTPGQAVVFYQGDTVVGGGIIERGLS